MLSLQSGGTPTLASSNEPKRTRIACVGDSITAGVGAGNSSMAYPAQLGRMLGREWEVGNFGNPGKSLLRKSDYPYAATANLQQALAFNPDVVVIQLGTNDTKVQNWKFRDDFVADYRALIARFETLETKPRIYLCRPPYISGPGSHGDTEETLLEVLPMIDAVGQETGLTVIDNHAVTKGRDELFPDHLHPNKEGAGLLARNVYRAIVGKEFVGDVPPPPNEALKRP
ncbi:GDSL-type esterase/lipase family protein [Verrucomicrobium sp. GAS474]|uniref:GDSL-type esterase/lipase family protein n=1 Tax=Verrucomicrobium sp. GAS474 TaxID=1882831 RepID=UPI002100FA32|nr:GDSL-type esterase/lipase family protein [Verrucomicrobium sp. GAS474]